MTLSDWLDTTGELYRELGVLRGTKVSVNELYIGGLRRLGKRWNYGEAIFEREWDMLIILDACRPDALATVADEYEFLPTGEIPTHTSLGSQSLEWMEKNFSSEYEGEISETVYVTSNVFSRELDEERFAHLDEVWRYSWDDDLGTIPPESVTDRTISIAREENPARLIAHYMQPHQPYRSFANGGRVKRTLNHDAVPNSPIHQLQRGEADRTKVWNAYVDNLRWVLNEVEVLLRNIDAERVVVSADHGEAMGEWWCYEHPEYAPIPTLKRVPWVSTSASDTREYVPTLEPQEANLDDGTVSDRLADLGYL